MNSGVEQHAEDILKRKLSEIQYECERFLRSLVAVDYTKWDELCTVDNERSNAMFCSLDKSTQILVMLFYLNDSYPSVRERGDTYPFRFGKFMTDGISTAANFALTNIAYDLYTKTKSVSETILCVPQTSDAYFCIKLLEKIENSEVDSARQDTYEFLELAAIAECISADNKLKDLCAHAYFLSLVETEIGGRFNITLGLTKKIQQMCCDFKPKEHEDRVFYRYHKLLIRERSGLIKKGGDVADWTGAAYHVLQKKCPSFKEIEFA